MSIDKKSLDENGNAVQGHNGGSSSVGSERKKSRRKHAQEPNVIVYKAENVEGHRGHHEDIDSLINFIENKDSKSKKGKTTSSAVRMKTSATTKSRSRDKDIKREQLPVQLHKSNSLEEVSKTKLEDLTAEKSISSSSAASSVSSQHGNRKEANYRLFKNVKVKLFDACIRFFRCNQRRNVKESETT